MISHGPPKSRRDARGTRPQGNHQSSRHFTATGSVFRPTASGQHTGGQNPPQHSHWMGWGATRCVTPRQTCPWPEGFGRNLRSKTRWFTGFCNSHQVSHFATFFIDARAEISVAESRSSKSKRHVAPRTHRTNRGTRDALMFIVLGAIRAGVRWCREEPNSIRGGLSPDARGIAGLRPNAAPRVFFNVFTGLSATAGFDNDPSAGSPTETLLRLLLPLNDKVQWTSRDVAGSEPPTSPRSEHFTGPFNR